MSPLGPIFASAIALAPVATQGRIPLDYTTMCMARVSPPGIPHVIARIHVDRDHAIVAKTLSYGDAEISAHWSVPGATLDSNSILTGLNGLTFPLPHDVAYPVTVIFAVDGEEVASRRFDAPTLG